MNSKMPFQPPRIKGSTPPHMPKGNKPRDHIAPPALHEPQVKLPKIK